ncbi:MAG: ribosome biogenesis GTPase Der [Hyphomicrobiaceae bacterium]|nr:ribosome biogenesis GTPase Der [Hyphomicrobiaceae bacterium]
MTSKDREIASGAPTLAIIGRPNVGKSTLFNRLTQTRDALVSDLPGLTRDRREGRAQLGSHTVKVVDTAGLEEAESGSIADRMRRQSESAIVTCDLVLFVIDAKAGVTPADKAFAKVARSSGKPVVLVANKSEGRAGRDGFYEAYELGFGEPVPISAEHGEGLGDLAVDILNALGLDNDLYGASADGKAIEKAERPIRIAIVGRPNAGKSTLVNSILGEDRMITGPEPGLTRDSVSTDFVWGNREVRLFDTAGLRKRARISELAEKLSASDAIKAIRFAEVVVLLIDAERPLEHQDLTIGDLVTQEGRSFVIAINKWDLIEDKQKMLRTIKERVGNSLAQVPDVPVVPLSALSERGIDKLRDAVFKAWTIWNSRVPTPQLNRWLIEATSRHAPPAASGRPIRLRFITQPSTRPPTFVAFCSKPDDLPQSYIRYLVNSLRQAFDLPGVPVRFNLRKGNNPYDKKRPKRG